MISFVEFPAAKTVQSRGKEESKGGGKIVGKRNGKNFDGVHLTLAVWRLEAMF